MAIVLRRTRAEFFVKAVWFKSGTSGAFAGALLAIRAAFATDRGFRLWQPVATAHVFVTAPAPLPILVAQVQVQLLFRFAIETAPLGGTRASVVVALLGAENRVPPMFGWALAFVRGGIRAALLSIVGTEARKLRIVPAAIVIAPVGVRTWALLLSIVGTQARAPPNLPAAIVIWPVGVGTYAPLLSIVGAEVRPPPIVPAAIVIAHVGVSLPAILLPFLGREVSA